MGCVTVIVRCRIQFDSLGEIMLNKSINAVGKIRHHVVIHVDHHEEQFVMLYYIGATDLAWFG